MSKKDVLFEKPDEKYLFLTSLLVELGSGSVQDERLHQAQELAFVWIQLFAKDVGRQLDAYVELEHLVGDESSARRSDRYRRLRKYEREYNVNPVELTLEFIESRVDSCLRELETLDAVIEAGDTADNKPLRFFAATQVQISGQELESLSHQSKMADVSVSMQRTIAWANFWHYVIHALDHSQREQDLIRAVVKHRD